MRQIVRLVCIVAALAATGSCHEPRATTLHAYGWAGYFPSDTLAAFQARTGIEVDAGVFDSNQLLETKLLTGHAGYDVVVTGAAYLERLAQAGALRKLDKSRLPQLANLDPAIVAGAATFDPGNAYGVPYLWGTNGLAFNRDAIAARLPGAPTDSWDLLFRPEVVARFADCGVGLHETPIAVVPSVLAWLGRDPNSESVADLALAEQALAAIRPYIRNLSNSQLTGALANGELCLIFASSGDAALAQRSAIAAGNGVRIAYTTPREGAQLWIDLLVIPVDAPRADAAHRFIDYLLEPRVAARVAIAAGLDSANAAARAWLPPAAPAAGSRLFPDPMKSDAYVRERLRMWTRFRTGS